MTKLMKFHKAFALVLVLAFAGVAFADFAVPGYNVLRGTLAPAVVKAAVTGADSTTWTAPLNAQITGGNQQVAAYASMGTASATCTLACGLYFKNDDATYTFLGYAGANITVTGTASGTVDGTKYPALTLATWDTKGAPYYDVRIVAISTGTATVRQWAFGAMSAGSR